MFKKYVYLLIVPLFIVGISCIPFFHVIAFENENSGKILAYYRIQHENEFSIRYTHSIHLSPVLETYKIGKNNTIIQTEITYEEFGVGMPENATGKEKFIQKNGKYTITNMNRVHSFLDTRVGKVIANHTFIIDKNEIPFSSFVEPGSWVRVKIRKMNIWEMLKGGHIVDR